MSITLTTALALAVLAAPSSKPLEAEDLVRQIHVEGLPFERVVELDRDTSVPLLLDLLKDPREEQHWPNVVIALGMLGDPRATRALITFLEADTKTELSNQHYRAKTQVLMALGYSINRSEDKRALEYLIAAVDPNVWKKRRLTWVSPYHAHADGRNEQLSTMALLGLALSAHPYAYDALTALQHSHGGGFRQRAADVIETALKEHEKIAADGLVRYEQRRLARARAR